MTSKFRRDEIAELIDAVANDPSRAESVKANLFHMISKPQQGLVRDRLDRPVMLSSDQDDFFDNMPV